MRKSSKSVPSSTRLDTQISKDAPAAFESLRAEITAVSPHHLVHVNLDISRAGRRGVVVAKRLEPLHPALRKLDGLDFAKIRDLRKHAMALLFANDRVDELESGATLAKVLAEATPLRENVLRTAELLGHFGLVPADEVAQIRSGQGHADTASDLVRLGVLLRDTWDTVKDKVIITRADVERCITLSAELYEAIGDSESDQDPLVERRDARRMRAQAYTLFIRAYDECRRGVLYLRWHHGDAAQIVPSLYPRRRRRSGTNDDVVDDAAEDLLDPGHANDPEPTHTSRPTTAADALVTA